MATRMQQRRGTASQWTTANPILNAGEIGFESDTNKFKIGDGTNHWADLNYFVDADTLIDGAPGLLDTLNELAAAIGDDPSFFTTVATNLNNHQSDSTNVHGITDTAELATKTFAAELLTNATKSNITITGDKNGLTITAENGVADSTTDNLTEGTTNKYFTNERAQDAVGENVGTGLSYNDSTGAISVDTTTIQARVADVSDTEIGYLNGVTSGIQSQLDDKAPLASPTFTGTVSGITATMVGLGNVDNTSDANKPVSTATQTALDLKANLASPTFTGTVTTDDLIVDGDFTVNGTNFAASATSIVIEDNLVQLAHQNSGNSVDLGIVVGYNDGSAKHAGIVRDVSTDKWKLFKGVTTEPSTTVDFTEGSLDTLMVATLEGDVTGNLTGDVTGNADTATALETARNIAGQSFDGTADISIAPTDLTGVTATAAEINILDGATLSTIELNYLTGVTSSIQTQLDDKVDAAYVDGAVQNAEVDQSTLAGTGITWNVATSQFDIDVVTTTLGGTGLTGFTAGDMIYASATDTLAALPKGTANQVMYMNSAGTAPEWRTAAAGAAFSELMLIGA